MADDLRTFIAIKIHPGKNLIDLLVDLKKMLDGEAIKWVEQNNMHLTLNFMGNTTLKQVEEVKVILKNVADQFNQFQFQLKGLGYFERNGQPNVLYSGIEGSNILKQIFNKIEKQVIKIGFVREQREFKPHLTLGRIKFLKNKSAFYNSIEPFTGVEFQHVNVSEIIFYQSLLLLNHPIYKSLKTIVLSLD